MNKISDEKLTKELIAQKKRVEALKYLESQGQSVESDTAILASAKTRTGQSDNTLELLLRQKAASYDSSKDIEHRAKSALISVQTSVRTAVQSAAQSTATAANSDWQTVVDPSTSKPYYWNKRTNITQWEMPDELANPKTGTAAGSSSRSMDDSNSIWVSHIHPATQQEYWVNKLTNEKRFEKPGAVSALSGADMNESTSVDISTKPAKRRKLLTEIDPLDPTEGRGERLGEAKDGRMADSTASGPLWQQRPYPAPGKALMNKTKPGASVGPMFAPTKK